MIRRDATFLSKLAAASKTRDSIVCVGLDPEPDRIPASLGEGSRAATTFLKNVVRTTSEFVCAYKPNLAFYEQYGTEAFDILRAVVDAIPTDIAIVLDAKRGDVPNTADAYARAMFDRFGADAVTVHPYVGMDAIEPFTRDGRYALVLARTSNPGARDLQDVQVDGRPLYERVVTATVAAFPADHCGFVVGATYPDEAKRLRALAPDRMFLMPGVGAQGGDIASAIRAGLDANGGGVLPSASRSVIFASSGADYERAAADAARSLRDTANAARATAMGRR